MQADAYAGFNRLYNEAARKPGPIFVEAACWAHARHKFFDLARLNSRRRSPAEAVTRIDALFTIEREINPGLASPQRVAVRTAHSRPLVVALETWLREQH